MARMFSSAEAKELIRKHRALRNKMRDEIVDAEEYSEKIKAWAEKLCAQELMNVLRQIPVEEVNREKRGFRVKSLHESGYHNIADLAAASVYQITAVRGISEDGAYQIKRIVNDIVEKAQKGIRIHLSTDDKTEISGQLLLNILKYKNSKPHKNTCHHLLEDYEDEIQDTIQELSIGKHGLTWLFSSRDKKQQAEKAYDRLEALSAGEYGSAVEEALLQLNAIKHLDMHDAWDAFEKQPIPFMNILDDLVPGLLETSDAFYGLPEDLAREIQDECFFPEGLLCQLRPYQEWGVKYTLHEGRALLGDEMGLGKTIQAIATMVSLKNTGATHFVVVCPASVLTNWCREINKHSKLKVTKIHGAGRDNAIRSWLETGGVAVTTYETAGYLKLDEEFRIALLVVDEAHYIKNEKAQRTVKVKELCEHADRLLFMTGTALENNVDEMIALIRILKPEIAAAAESLKSLSSAPAFRQTIAPVYFRRRREDVLKELPELVENKEWCSMLPEEEEAYEDAVFAKNYAEARRVSWNVEDLSRSSKAQRMLEIIEEAEQDGRKIIVFSFFLDTIRKISLLLGKRCTQPINGSVSPDRRQEIIDEFDKAPAGSVLVAQIQSGGTGLNIQSASIVIICEPQFKPSIENQAISRAYRMGQTRNVFVYRLLCEESVDEKLTERLEEKQNLFDEFADESVAAQKTIEISQKNYEHIIEEEIERINKKRGILPAEEKQKEKQENEWEAAEAAAGPES